MNGVFEELFDINDVMRITKLGKSTIRRYIVLNQIPYYRIVGSIRFRPSEIYEWINTQREKGSIIFPAQKDAASDGASNEGADYV
jgi:predicted DNA-binding transcriptional regulator AlpA